VRERPFVGSIDIANMFELLGRADLKASPSGTFCKGSSASSFEKNKLIPHLR